MHTLVQLKDRESYKQGNYPQGNEIPTLGNQMVEPNIFGFTKQIGGEKMADEKYNISPKHSGLIPEEISNQIIKQ